MKHSIFSKVALLTATAAGALTVSRTASADPTDTCYDAALRPNVVYVAGSSAVKPFIGVVAPLLAQSSPSYTIVYQALGSCVGVNNVFNTDPAQRMMKDIPAANGKSANYAVYFSADGLTSTPCLLTPGGNNVDVGVSDVFADTCGFSTPAGVEISDYQGPIQPMTFVVPAASSQRSISSEAAYMAFGLGGNKGAAAPWIDPAFFFVRNATSGTQQLLAHAIGVPGDKWWGVDRGGSGAVRDQLKLLLDPATAEKAIGILSTDVADDERASLRVLKFQAKDQSCAFGPDSTPFAFDKANVRDGHYPLWGPVHFYTFTKGGIPSTAAASLVSRFAALKPDTTLLDAIAKKHLVPKCSMRVTRSKEMGPLSAYTSDQRCSCYYDNAVNGKTSCKTCMQSSDCPAETPACNYGYCEKP